VREAVLAASARAAQQPLLQDLLVEPSWQQVGGRQGAAACAALLHVMI
jgi:hypothetical protein